MTDTLIVKDDGPIRILTLNRPDKLNALTGELMASLLHALCRAGEDESVAAVVLTGNGRAFCAGRDVKDFKPSDNVEDQAKVSHGLYSIFAEMPKPVIAAVNGYALGGGCGLAVSCDMIIASETAIFGYPEVTRGAVPSFVMPSLVRQIGRKAAFELVITGRKICAARAEQLGLVNRIVSAETLLQAAVDLGNEIAQFSRQAVRDTKQLFHQVADLPLKEALDIAHRGHVTMRAYSIRTGV